MSTIVLIRHGETGMAGRFCGHSDPDLNTVGQHEAIHVAEEVSRLSIARIYSSDLRRASQTAKAIAQQTGIAADYLTGLREVHFGQWEGLTWQEIEARFPDEADQWLREFPLRSAPGGETYTAFTARVETAIAALLCEAADMTIAVVTHLGICGGMQMLGSMIEDPYAVEGGGREEGLCLLPIRTVMAQEKTTREAEGDLLHPQLFGQPISASTVRGYEIHVGQTEYLGAAEAFTRIRRTSSPDEVVLDGCVGQQGRAIGTYLHGIFHHDEFRHSFLSALRASSGLEQPQSLLQWKELREQQFDRLAGTVSSAVDLRTLLGWVGLPWPAERKQETLCASRP